MFHVGQKVVCVFNDVGTGFIPEGASLPIVGKVYTIRSVYVCPALQQPGCRVQEIILPKHFRGGEYGFSTSWFRPIVDNKSEISFTDGADPASGKWDNRRKQKVRELR
jgi:hypothetical protein